MKNVTNRELYDFSETAAAPLFEQTTYPWEILPLIHDFVQELGASLPADEYEKRGTDVWIAKDATVFQTATILGPCVIGHRTEVRPGAFIRGNVLVGEDCVVGNSTELKNVILFNHVQVPHYNYVGDSILGHFAHMGAGSITSNVKSDKTPVVVKQGGERIETGLKKFGCMLGHHVEVGCGSILNPGSVICPNTNIYPLSSVRGVIPADSILKDGGRIAAKK